jgi:hypothetical protein
VPGQRTALICAGGVALLATVVPSAGLAARQPSLGERSAITRALPAFVRRAPVACVFVAIKVSTRNSRYARATPKVLNIGIEALRCIRYAANGYFILRKTTRWRIVFEGSDPPPCRLGVPRDLTPCLKR